MIDLLKWLWGGILSVAKWTRKCWGMVWDALCNWVSWVIASMTYVLHLIYGWISDLITDAVSSLSSAFGDIGDLLSGSPSVSALAAYYLYNVLAIDVAFECLVIYGSVWLAAKSARFLMVPIKAILDLL